MNRWEIFNGIIDNENLTTHEKMLAIVIFRFINHKTNTAFPSVETLMKLAGIGNKQTFYKAKKGLESKGILKSITIKGKGCQYTLVSEVNHVQNNYVKNSTMLGTNVLLFSNKNEQQKEDLKEKTTSNNIISDNFYYDWMTEILNEISTEFVC